MTDDHRDDTSIRDFNNWADTAARTSRNSTHRKSGTIKYATTSSNASSIKKKSSSSREVYMTMHIKTKR